jgi:glycosyltransferase involved in cell wall biosynthesis
MRIGIVIFKDDPQAGGGLTYVQEILEGLNRRLTKTEHRFYLIGVEREKPAHLGHIDLPWLGSYQAEMLPRPPASDFEYYPEVAKANLDLLCYLQPWMGQIRDIPYISTVWDLAHRCYPFFPEVSLYGEFGRREDMFRRYLQRATYIITPNEAGKKEIIAFYQVAEDRVRLIHHPTPTFALEGKPHPDPERLLHRLGIDRDFLLYPAQLWPHKNHILLLLMLDTLRKQHGENLQLILTGSNRGNFPFLTHKIAQLGLENQVVLAGFVSRPDLVALYQKAIALVYPCFFGPENFPPMEAFALGCPVIAAKIPGAKEQMGDAAILLDPTNPELWSQAVMLLRQDAGLRQSLIIKGKKRALAFTPDDCAREMLNLFDEFALYRRTWPTSEDGLDESTP